MSESDELESVLCCLGRGQRWGGTVRGGEFSTERLTVVLLLHVWSEQVTDRVWWDRLGTEVSYMCWEGDYMRTVYVANITMCWRWQKRGWKLYWTATFKHEDRSGRTNCQDIPFHSLSYLIVILSYHTIWLHQGLNPGPVDTWPGLDPVMTYSEQQNRCNVFTFRNSNRISP